MVEEYKTVKSLENNWLQRSAVPNRNGFLSVLGHISESGPWADLHRTFNLINPN